MTARLRLSFGEQIDLLFRLILFVPAFGLITFIYRIPTAVRRKVPLSTVAISSWFRTNFSCLTPRQIRSMAEDSHAAYRKWIVSKRQELEKNGTTIHLHFLKADIEELESTGGSIMWLGDRSTASKFVLFMHGGGYLMPIMPGHFEWCWNAYLTGGPGEAQNVAVAVLEYSLMPEAVYPEQLMQACAAFQKLLDSGIRPSNIMMGGDSAGGIMAVQILRHLIEPHPSLQPLRSLLTEPLAAVFAVSAPFSARTDTLSFQENSLDMMNRKIMEDLVGGFLNPDRITPKMSLSEVRALAEPLEGDLSWVEHLESVAKAMYITAGGQEVFRDHSCMFVDIVRSRCKSLDLEFDLTPTDAQDVHFLEGMFKQYGKATRSMAEWAKIKL